MELSYKIMLIEVKVGALIMDPNSNSPIVVLKGIESDAILPIWVGGYEANAIALEIEKVVPQRPMTHDLLRNIIIEMGLTAEKIIVTDLVENTFYAVIELTAKDGKTVSIDARPSDAIALALRTDCPIFIAQKVMDISNTTASVNLKQSENIEELQNSIEEWPDLIG